jgi:hypothetical protein
MYVERSVCGWNSLGRFSLQIGSKLMNLHGRFLYSLFADCQRPGEVVA